MNIEYSPQERTEKVMGILAEGVLNLMAKSIQEWVEVYRKEWEKISAISTIVNAA